MQVSLQGGTFTQGPTAQNVSPPQGFQSPYGAIAFTAQVPQGGTLTVTLTFPSPIPQGAVLKKYLNNAWQDIPGAQLSGSTATYQVQDGGPLDGDGQANGQVVDPVALLAPAPSFALSLNPSSLAVQQGGQGQVTLTLTPQNGFTGTVALSLALGQDQVPQGLSLSPTSVQVTGPSPVSQALTISASSSTPTGTYRIKVRGTAGSLTKEADLTVTVSAPSGGGTGPQAWYFSPADFQNGVLTFRLPSTSLTKALIALVPGMSPAEFYRDSNYWLVPFNFTLERGSFSPTAASPKPVPAPKTIPLQNWGSPYQAPPQEPPLEKSFDIWDPSTQRYQTITGQLVYQGQEFLYYEETVSGKPAGCFSTPQYQQIDQAASWGYAEVKRLMGPPTDFDGNGKIIVLLSTTIARLRGTDTAYFDGEDVHPNNPNRSEILYFPCATPWSNPQYLASDWIPRNIIHEAVHLHQIIHWYRRSNLTNFGWLRWPFSEAQAELFRHKLEMGINDKWSDILYCFTTNNGILSFTTNYCEYHTGGLVHWWMHQRYGEGFEQALIEAYPRAHETQQGGPYEIASGLPDPLASALTFLSLHLDETPQGEALGLHFPQDDIPRRMGTQRPPLLTLSSQPLSLQLKYLQSVVVSPTDPVPGEAIRVSVDNPKGAYVVVVVW
ncbi:choice-of-anchor U domain-containing protein [Thermus thermophilus]|uniref:COG1470 family protein n=1 Tax=Thermus thermophilus TaxID=274 RepID=UPI0033410476